MRKKVVSALRPLHAVSVENSVSTPGYPDVDYAGGKLELKWAREWPKRETTPLRLDHYTDAQKRWHAARQRAGGLVHVLLQVRNEWLLFDSLTAAIWLGEFPRSVLLVRAERVWTSEAAMTKHLAAYLLECSR